MRIEPTREGKRFLLALLVVGFTSLNTGNNLMYLTFSMMAALFVISLVAGFLNLKSLQTALQVDEPIFAGQSKEILLSVKNRKWFTSYSIRFLLEGITREGLYIAKVPPGNVTRINQRVLFQKRGVYEMRYAIVQTSFPFIFFRFRQKAPLSAGTRGTTLRVVVYPRLLDIERVFGTAILTEEQRGRLLQTEGEEVHSLRQYRPGDHWRAIHWKSTAKRGDLMVKEFVVDEPERVTVVLDNSLCKEEEAFEKAVSLSASLLYEAVQRGYSVRLITSSKAFPFGSGMEHLWRMLDCLAVLRSPRPFEAVPPMEEREILFLVLPDEKTFLGHLIPRAERVFYASDI